jgi:hypothetical protein
MKKKHKVLAKQFGIGLLIAWSIASLTVICRAPPHPEIQYKLVYIPVPSVQHGVDREQAAQAEFGHARVHQIIGPVL